MAHVQHPVDRSVIPPERQVALRPRGTGRRASSRFRRGLVGDLAPWLALSATVTAIDLTQLAGRRPTLSAAHQRAVRHPLRRWPILAVWLLVGTHLTIGKP